MRRIRIIPVLTLQNEKLVKTIKFKKPNYIGDPINAVKIFNDKEVDEIVILDISATKEKRPPNFKRIEEIASESFMPFAYGGGITTMKHIEGLFNCGIEKVVLNSILAKDLSLIKEASSRYGSQSIVASIDVGKNWLGKESAYVISGSQKVNQNIPDYVKAIERAGAGEIFLTSIDKDGTYSGYDYILISRLSKLINIPIVASGGAASVNDFTTAIQAGASAVAAGSLFVYQGLPRNLVYRGFPRNLVYRGLPRNLVYRGAQRGILINYPTQEKLKKEVFCNL